MVTKLLKFGFGRNLPVILQTEAAECGLACLAMIAGYHSFDTDVVTLRQRFSISTHGTTVAHLIGISSRMEMSARALKVSEHDLDKLQLPCMLHWDLNHFVVLKSIKRGKMIIHDPATGERIYNLRDFNKHYTGVAVEFTPTSGFKKEEVLMELKLGHFWKNIKGLKRSLGSIIVLALILQFFSILSPFFMQLVLDDVILHDDDSLLLVLAIGFGLLVVIETATSLFRSVVILNMSTNLSIQMASNLYRHLIRLPVDFFQKRHIGDILSRIGSLDNIKELITSGLIAAIVDGFMAAVTIAVMFYYSVTLTYISLTLVASYAALRYIFFKPIKRLEEESLVVGAKLETHNIESIRAIQTIKIFQKESDRQGQWHNKLADAINKGIRVAQWGMGFSGINQLLFGLGGIVSIYFGAQAVLDQAFSVGMLMAFLAYQGRFTQSVNNLIDQWINFKMISVHLNRLADIAFAEQESVDEDIDYSMDSVAHGGNKDYIDSAQYLKGRLEVRNLSYAYAENTPAVFSGLNFVIEPGETVALVGPSGSGKTTLLKCLMGLLNPTEGEVLIDGIPLSDHKAYRSQIAGVMQDDQLISGTIKENISFFPVKVDDQRVRDAATFAGINEEILAFPMQYETFVGDMGSSLSGGQKQRVVLARAFYRRPRILFLDEATSHLDITNEKVISGHIREMDITRIFVAHRPETIASADREICVA